MRKLLLAVAVVLSGCVGSPVGDAMLGPQKLAEMDSQYCRSIGAQPGTQAFVQCRLYKDAERRQNHREAFAQVGAALQAADAAQPRMVTCRRFGNTVNCW